jgi:ABC-type nitrate/sulfonate/bicarbonate transport system ATPase subunit
MSPGAHDPEDQPATLPVSPASPQPFLVARGLAKAFRTTAGRREVLRDVHLSAARGEFVSIVGPMGCGKSTLLAMLAGLLRPDAGEVVIAGSPVGDVRRDTAIVFQHYSLLPWCTALENVRLAVQAAFPTEGRRAHRDRARRWLEIVGLGQAAERRPAQLSGGMRQRVAIARAFATEPELLFLDEPFGALDALTRGGLQTELASMCADGGRSVTTLLITNSVEEAILLSDRIVPMTRGPRATLGEPIAVPLSRPRSLEQLVDDDEAAAVRAGVIARLTMEHGSRTDRTGSGALEAAS